MVKTPRNLTMSDLKEMILTKADSTDKNGKTTTYSGVLLSTLLDKAGISDNTSVTIIGSNAYTSPSISISDLKNCAVCIAAILDDGSLQSVLPGQSGKMQVKNMVEIQVK